MVFGFAVERRRISPIDTVGLLIMSFSQRDRLNYAKLQLQYSVTNQSCD